MTNDADPPLLESDTVPVLPRGVRLREDPERGWILLAPERVLSLDPPAVAVLSEVDGEKSFGAIVEALAARYAAPREIIAKDASLFLQDLIAKRILEIRS